MKVIERTKIWYTISIAIILVGAAFLIFRGMNFDIEFAGGTMVQIDIGQEFDARSDIEPIVREITGDTNPQVQKVSGTGGATQVSIKVKEITTEQIDQLYTAIAEKYGLDTVDNANLVSHSSISPTVSGEMQKTAVIATSVAALLMLLYITFRFKDWRFGLSSIIALLHDVLIVMAMYAIFQIPVNNTFIAAILTIVGYSINNTIVVFDRIRENTRLYRQDQLNQLCDDSIMQTLSRSINTSLTTIVMVLVLFILGVQSVRWFAFPLLVGFLAGTYSSIFIASPTWVLLKRIGRKGKKGGQAVKQVKHA